MDWQTFIIAMSIPISITAYCFWIVEWKMKGREKEAKEKEQIRQKNEILMIKSIMASMALAEATATDFINGRTNGEIETALEYARKAKNEQRNFLIEQGIKSIYD